MFLSVVMLFTIFLCVNLPREANSKTQQWTAKAAVLFALSENPDASIAKERIEQANAVSRMIRATDYPTVNLNAEYSQTNNPMYSFGNILNQGAFNQSIDFNDPGRTDNLLLRAEIRYRLYNGGRSSADKNAADAKVRMSEVEIEGLHQRLGFEVVKSFQTIIQAEKMVEVRKEALSAINAAYAVGLARYEAGELLKQDLLNLELQQSRASENLIQSGHNHELAQKSFLNLLGLPDQKVLLNDTKDGSQSRPKILDFHNRYEIKHLKSLEEEAMAELKKAEGGKRPTMDAFASYHLDQGWELDEQGDSWMAGLRLNYTLFDGQKTTSDIAVSKSRLNEIRFLLKKTELALGLDVERADLNYKQAQERLSVTEKMVHVAEEMVKLSRVRFKEGVILASDLIDFEMRLTDAKARHLAAKSSYQVAIANLIRAAGMEQFSDKKAKSSD